MNILMFEQGDGHSGGSVGPGGREVFDNSAISFPTTDIAHKAVDSLADNAPVELLRRLKSRGIVGVYCVQTMYSRRIGYSRID